MTRPLDILCVQNDTISPAGFVGEMIYRRGGTLEEIMPHEGDALPAGISMRSCAGCSRGR